MIPKIIWQTYETEYNDLPYEAKKHCELWQKLNPDYEYRYMSAKDRDQFVKNNFDNRWYELFNKFESGIIKANIWRSLVVYKYGGFYCDLDTVCNKPLNEWVNQDCDLIICNDDATTDIAIFAFFASQNNIILKNILHNIKKNLILMKTIDKQVIVNMTGETVWTKIINHYTNNLSILDKYNIEYFNDKSNLYSYNNAIKHLGLSKKWSNNYIQWSDRYI